MLPLWDIEAVTARLPAEQRAKLAWMRAPMRAAFARLKSEPPTDELLDEVARALARPSLALTQVLLQGVPGLEAWRAELEPLVREDTETMNRFLTDEDVRDTFAWCMGFFHSVFELFGAMSAQNLAAMPDSEAQTLAEAPGTVLLLKAEAGLLGALDVARAGGDPERATAFIELAFLAVCVLQDALRREYMPLDPFSNETPDERAERTLRYARELRATLTTADAEALEAARLRSLR